MREGTGEGSESDVSLEQTKGLRSGAEPDAVEISYVCVLERGFSFLWECGTGAEGWRSIDPNQLLKKNNFRIYLNFLR